MKRHSSTVPLNINSDLTFQSVFKKEISQKVLIFYLDQLKRSRPAICGWEFQGPFDFISNLKAKNPNLTQKRLLEILGLKVLLDEIGVRAYQNLFPDRWYKTKKIMELIESNKKEDRLKFLSSALDEFKPLKLIDFQEKMINNDKHE